MKMNRSILAAVLAACAAPALAQVTSGATLGNLGYTLYDLDLSDTHTPSLVFSVPDGVIPPYLGGGFTAVSYVERVDYRPVLIQDGGRSADATSLSASWEGRAGAGEARLGGRGGTGMDQRLDRWVEVREAPGVQAQVTPDSWSDNIYFTLSPGTRVTFTATLEAWSNFTLDDDYYGATEVLGALTIRNLRDLNNGEQSDARLWFAGTEPGMPPAFSRNVLLSVSYENRGADPLYAYAKMDLDGMAYTIPVSMVPEPGQLSMLLAGALVLPLALRRRRKNAALDGAAFRPAG